MFKVPAAAVVNWARAGNVFFPAAIDQICPLCKRDVTFTPRWQSDTTGRGMPNPTRCPRCGDSVDLIRLGGPSQDEARLYIDAENPARQPMADLDQIPDDQIDPRLKKAYQSALRVFAIGDPEATAVHCRRALEGVTKRLLPPGTKTRNLAESIKAMAKHEDLAAPLIDLSQTVRKGGNLGAHLDDETETSIEDARQLLELLEYLLIYLFVLPVQIHRFRSEVLKTEQVLGSDPCPAVVNAPTTLTEDAQ